MEHKPIEFQTIHEFQSSAEAGNTSEKNISLKLQPKSSTNKSLSYKPKKIGTNSSTGVHSVRDYKDNCSEGRAGTKEAAKKEKEVTTVTVTVTH